MTSLGSMETHNGDARVSEQTSEEATARVPGAHGRRKSRGKERDMQSKKTRSNFVRQQQKNERAQRASKPTDLGSSNLSNSRSDE